MLTGLDDLNTYVTTHENETPTDAAAELQDYLAELRKGVECRKVEDTDPDAPAPREECRKSVAAEPVATPTPQPRYPVQFRGNADGRLSPAAIRDSRAGEHAAHVAALLKAQQGPQVFLRDDRPSVADMLRTSGSLLEQTTLCKSCGTSRMKALTACEQCGEGQLQHYRHSKSRQ